MNSSFQRLVEIFDRFPGIGERQAKRFVYYLLNMDNVALKHFAEAVLNLKNDIKQCEHCARFFLLGANKTTAECDICADDTRDKKMLMVVEKDIDLDNIKRADIYNGHYFVLGGTIPILEKNPEKKVRLVKLKNDINRRAVDGLKEIIFALSATTEGENTAEFLREELSKTAVKYGIKIDALGRGLSTGTELEYSDAETIKNAFKHRE